MSCTIIVVQRRGLLRLGPYGRDHLRARLPTPPPRQCDREREAKAKAKGTWEMKRLRWAEVIEKLR